MRSGSPGAAAPVVLGLIPARGGSQGLPGKNLIPLLGRPLIEWTLTSVFQATRVTRAIVSTDHPGIRDTARAAGAEVPFLRPSHLAGDTTPMRVVIDHVLEWVATQDSFAPDYIVLLQPTSPLRTAMDIDEAIALAIDTRADAVVAVRPARDHPALLKRQDGAGRLTQALGGDWRVDRRQDMESLYVPNGAIYVATVPFLLTGKDWYDGTTIGYVMPEERSVDIDTPWDLAMAECGLRRARQAST
jgi:CMP-N,N'-diacetyllegionaminic acid synthase